MIRQVSNHMQAIRRSGHWLLILLLSVLHFGAVAQPYHNEWISYDKTYWKFRLGTEGVFRISKTTLDNLGVPAAVTGDQFMLFRDGKEVAIYTTTSGTLASGDYLEFYAIPATGLLDKELYLDAAKQSDEQLSLFSDTAAYFLTYDNTSGHQRYAAITTAIPPAPPAPASYCRKEVSYHGRSGFLEGKTLYNKDLLFSSQFDAGEGFGDFFNAWETLTKTLATPNLYSAAGLNVRLRTASMAQTFDSLHHLKFYFNSNLMADVVYGTGDIQKFDMSIPVAQVSASNTIQFTHYNPQYPYDRCALPYYSLDYPRDFNFSGYNFFRFRMEANGSAQYLEISNFVHGGTPPRLYDLTNNKYYTGDISVSGKTRFYIDPSVADMEFLLYAGNSSLIYDLPTAKQIKFTNYTTAANQGNYVIITHKNLERITDGRNYIQDYSDYRSSAAGGSYQVVTADIEELYDQYAYGVDIHPLSISSFLAQAYNSWGTRPAYVFLIGKGISYDLYKTYQPLASSYPFEGLVPTYGHPGSDVDFVNNRTTWMMNMAIARLSAWNPGEVRDYLNKVKSFDAAVNPAVVPSPESDGWKKEILHVAGGDDASNPGLQELILLPTLGACANIAAGPFSGSYITTVAKNTKGLPQPIADKMIDSLIANGLQRITYYGHGSSSSLDYNLPDPSNFNTVPRLPFFDAYGCAISDIYKLTRIKTPTELWVAAPNSGSIAALSSNNVGLTNIHSAYMPLLYTDIASTFYGQTLGRQYVFSLDTFALTAPGEAPATTSQKLAHIESYILMGDPAVKLPPASGKPDFYVGSAYIGSIPVNVTTASDSFTLKVVSFNLGKAISDTVRVKVEHINPASKTVVAKSYVISNLYNSDTTYLTLPVDKIADIGLNKYRVTIDPDNHFDELSKANNVATFDVFIYSDNVVPVYPQNFGIVYGSPEVTLKASTLNAFKGVGRYRLEMDTTELFNSPGKQQTVISSRGGVIKWKPSVALQDSTVYYWRSALDSLEGGSYVWSGSSFVYLKYGSPGWNQSHYYQYKYDKLDSNFLYQDNRRFAYSKSEVSLRVVNSIMSMSPPNTPYTSATDNRVLKDGTEIQRYDCSYVGTIQFIVMDTNTCTPWQNPVTGTQGSNAQCGLLMRNVQCFSFNTNTPESRNSARRFLDSIPNGYYVLAKNVIYAPYWNNAYADVWKSDTLIYGSGVSLYHSMRKVGFNQIDSFNRLRVFAMIAKKGFPDFEVQQAFSNDINEQMDVTFTVEETGTSGAMTSIQVGPAVEWKSLKWRTSPIYDTISSIDSSQVIIRGIDINNNLTQLYAGSERDVDLSFIRPQDYPRLQLEWFNMDTVYHTAPQLNYWRVLYTPYPEAALNPAAYYAFTDSVSVGQLMNFETAIETLNEFPMDSMLVRYRVIDANNVSHLLMDKKYRKLAGNDSLHASVSFDPKPYPGNNYLFIEANPDNNQPEQYHPNNLGYIPFSIKTDNQNPLLDVTFDGTHILDKDIVSPRPFIKVLLRDENKYVGLSDTSTMKLFMKYPQDDLNTRRRIPYDGSVCKFVPANVSSGKNEAYIEYRPDFDQDGIYQLYVSASDPAGNVAGAGDDYTVSFEVVNRSTISNLLNYPNPFSTSTAFVFTLTGAQIPSQMKIQIMTVTGKVVREITKEELGPIHIGRNLTEYHWDGRDQYGQLLGNGVYLYRVVTSINGSDIERRASGADKFYKNGYSKMYIMR